MAALAIAPQQTPHAIARVFWNFLLAFCAARGNTLSVSEFVSIGNAMFIYWNHKLQPSTEAMLSIALGQDPRANL
jgi:hypothetical protein